MSSIYISIATMEDSQLLNTIFSALDNSSKKNKIHIGVALLTSKEYYDFISSHISDEESVSFSNFNIEENFGLGKSRKNAQSFYDGEDYFLQVDSHTCFMDNWDIVLIDLFNESLEKTNNVKTAMTAYLGQYYQMEDGSIKVNTSWSRYAIFNNERFHPNISIGAWKDYEIRQWPLGMGTKEKIIPANKINGQFIFSNQSYVDSKCLPESCLFIEEEILSSINILDSGFSLSFPNTDLPLMHLPVQFASGVNKRQTVTSMLDIPDDALEWIMSRNYYDFIYNPENIEKCKKFQDHSKYNVYPDTLARPFHIPEKFSY